MGQGRKKIVGFDAVSCKAPLVLRCAAFLIDYLLIVFFPVLALLIGRLLGYDGARLLNSTVSSVGWTLTIFIGVANLIFLPMYLSASVGKILTGLRIVTLDGAPPSLGALALRHTVGYALSILSLGAGLLPVLISPRGRSLHDRLAGTVVIFAEEKLKQDEV